MSIQRYTRAYPHVFDMYFASIASFQYHPANPAATRLTLDECARIAIQMLAVRQDVMAPLPEGVPFDGVDAGLEV